MAGTNGRTQAQISPNQANGFSSERPAFKPPEFSIFMGSGDLTATNPSSNQCFSGTRFETSATTTDKSALKLDTKVREVPATKNPRRTRGFLFVVQNTRWAGYIVLCVHFMSSR